MNSKPFEQIMENVKKSREDPQKVGFEETNQAHRYRQKTKRAEARVGSIWKTEVWTVFGTWPAL